MQYKFNYFKMYIISVFFFLLLFTKSDLKTYLVMSTFFSFEILSSYITFVGWI